MITWLRSRQNRYDPRNLQECCYKQKVQIIGSYRFAASVLEKSESTGRPCRRPIVSDEAIDILFCQTDCAMLDLFRKGYLLKTFFTFRFANRLQVLGFSL